MEDDRENIQVSVVILTYNHEKYVEDAVRSVLSQEFDEPCELLIGDDASSDRTTEIIEGIKGKHNWLVKPVLRAENIGMQRNFLDLLERSCGKYIAFCDGDDYWIDPRKLGKQFSTMESNSDLAITYHDCKVLQDDVLIKDDVRKSIDVDSRITELASGNFMRTASVMVRNNLRSYPQWVLEMPNPDYAVWMLHAMHGKIRKLEFTGAVYRKHQLGHWSAKENSIEESLQVANSLEIMVPHFTGQVQQRLKERLARVAFFLHRHYLSHRETGKSRDFLTIALRSNEQWVNEKLQCLEMDGGGKKPSIWKRLMKMLTASK